MKRSQIILLITLAHIATFGVMRDLRAESGANAPAASPPARPTIQKPLTREDAELMLREAHSKIEQGRLEEADAIIIRVENAHVPFPLFHTGPSPSSARRELTRAQRLQVASKSLSHNQPNAPNRYLPFSRPSGGQATATSDPFAARNRNLSQMPSPSAANSQPAPLGPEQRLAGISAPESSQSASQSLAQPHAGRSSDNPFASAGRPAGLNAANMAGESPAPQSALNYPASHDANDKYAFDAASPLNPSDTPSAIKSSSGPNDSTLPDAPLPSSAPDGRSAAASDGLMPPKRAAASSTAPESRYAAVPAKQQAQQKLSAARQALDAGQIDLAEKLAQAAGSLGVPESQFLPDEDRPSLVAWDIAQAKQKDKGRHKDAIATDYRTQDRGTQSSPPPPPIPLPPISVVPQMPHAAPIDQRADDGPQIPMAMPLSIAERPPNPTASRTPPLEELPLPQAAESRAATAPKGSPSGNALPPAPVANSNSAQPAKPQAAASKPAKSLIDSADEAQQIVMRKLYSEVGKRQADAIRMREKDPERALATLREAQQLVNDSKLPESSRRELSSRIDKTLHDTQEYAKAHSTEIAVDKRNESVKADVDHDRDMKLKLRQKIAEQVNEYNHLNHEQRYAEAEIIARRMYEMAPDDPVVAQIWTESKLRRRDVMNRQLVDNKEKSVWDQLNAVEESAVNPVAADGKEQVYGKHWSDLVAKRKGSKDRVQRHTERELEIERRLQTPVLLRYQETPLSEAMGNLSELTGVNIHLDPRGLSQEGVNSDTPVTIHLSKEISLKSALNLILEPLHLSYVINDEVLKITSDQIRDGEIYPQTYNVADLVTPIPNFVPSSNMGLQGLINDSMAAAGRGSFGVGNNGPTVLVNDRAKPAVGPNGKVLAQQLSSTPLGANGASSSTVPIGAGPGGMGAGANADFDSLIDLIVSTVSQDTWAENGGGAAEIKPFPTNLSLVISQTQAVHEEIADLLQQLRRLQDLQVTIEVRFIRLNDRFFERIGIDFDMNIVDQQLVGQTAVRGGTSFTPGPPATNVHSATVGLQQSATGAANFTSDLDIPFNQGSFNAAVPPPFGGFDPNSAANLGFAILSDIEAFFLIQAAQGDSRTNVLEAPKVTLFNGQQAFVADATQRPFVVGVIPVVGEFASAQQPVIVVLNEGTMMTIQAVVSDDRRYVRLTIVPFFTQIGNVDTFTFEGSTSSTSSSSATDSNNDGKNEKKDDSNANAHSGVTVQLPSFSFVSVVTTVSVPDGGTVLLGGIKRLSEGRNEFGVPLLSKIPYLNRLFKNVGIARSTESLMMMVTPRIIIQEEEEERLGIAAP